MSEHTKAPALEEVKWRDAREAVKKVNPALARVIDKIDPSDKLPLCRARYPFGSKIIEKGMVFLPPKNGQQQPLETFPFAADFGYTMGIPTGIVLNNTVEIFLTPRERIIPFSLMPGGSIFSLWRALDPDLQFSYHAREPWNMTAGARSLFMLPKITQKIAYKKLSKARGLKLPMPHSLAEHSKLFTHMSCHSDFPDNWQAELLFFSAPWFERRKNKAWLRFRHFLLEDAWKRSQFWRNKMIFDFMWDSFVEEIAEEKIKAEPYIFDMVKHLIMVGLGVLPGFAPAIDDKAGPISALKDDFIQHYGLKYFAPTIMIPHYLSRLDKRPVYWSLKFPACFNSTPEPHTKNSTLDDLAIIKHIMDVFLNAAAKNKIKGIAGTPLEPWVNDIRLDYFHSDLSQANEIRQCKEMAQEDANLLAVPKKYGERKFSEISPFVRGCVRLSYLNY